MLLKTGGKYTVQEVGTVRGAGGSGCRFPAVTRGFLQTGSGAYTASYSQGSGVVSWVELSGPEIDHSPPTSAQTKN